MVKTSLLQNVSCKTAVQIRIAIRNRREVLIAGWIEGFHAGANVEYWGNELAELNDAAIEIGMGD